ncbi:hypothetical protein [Mesoplasma seiffertii]|uniref:hypothetical protein n=1 Tax=Mesoplasma seiffertii TaxID=28224 RepID=UPI00047ACAEC|nr:hypothetical protein [Mesoplasma seiffertii]
MAKELKPVIISDPIEVAELEKHFAEQAAKIATKVYTSVTEERLRVNKIIKTKKIKAPVEEVFRTIITNSTHNLHPNLNYEDLQAGAFYRASGKINKLPFKITKFVENEEMAIKWYAKDQEFIKTLVFTPNKSNTVTKIRYSDISTGMVSILGYFEKHIRNLYTKRQVIAFQVQCKQAEIDLGLLSPLQVEKANKTIARMLKYSKEAY